MTEAAIPAHVRFGEAPAPPQQRGPITQAVLWVVSKVSRNPDLAEQPQPLPDPYVYTTEPLAVPDTPFRLGDTFDDWRKTSGITAVIGADLHDEGSRTLRIGRTWLEVFPGEERFDSPPEELVELLRDGAIVPMGSLGGRARMREICEAVAVLPEIPAVEDFWFNRETRAGYGVVNMDGLDVPFVSAQHVADFARGHRGIFLGRRVEQAFDRLYGDAKRASTTSVPDSLGCHIVDGVVYLGTEMPLGRTHTESVGLTPVGLVDILHATEQRPDVADIYGFSPGAREWLRRYVLALHAAPEVS